MLKRLKTIDTSIKYVNPYWEYRLDKYSMPSADIGEYHYVHSRGSTFIIPKLAEDSYVMTKQFRYLNQKESIEFPGGGLKEGLSFEANALCELQEEAGYIPGNFRFIGEFNPFNGVTNETCKVFLAENLTKCEAIPDYSEEFEIITLKKIDIINKIKKGEIWDGMTLASWAILLMMEYQG
jgi:ADP-ribose pyrophosphatase